MINGLGVLGWGVGGIEAEAAMLGQPISMLIPDVVGFRLTGKLHEGITATDLVLTVTRCCGRKASSTNSSSSSARVSTSLPLADRATIANMAPEYGATCGFFPVDAETLSYLRCHGRPADTVALVEAYAKAQGMLRTTSSAEPVYTDTLELDLGTVEPSARRAEAAAGSRRASTDMRKAVRRRPRPARGATIGNEARRTKVAGSSYDLRPRRRGHRRDHVSCTNTSNPSVMLAAGLWRRKRSSAG